MKYKVLITAWEMARYGSFDQGCMFNILLITALIQVSYFYYY